jgi:hypothetical protein
MVKHSTAKADKTYDGSGQPTNDHVAQSNDGGEFTEQQDGGPSTGSDPGSNDINDQSQNRAQTDANLEANQNRQDSDNVGLVEPAPGADPNGDQYNNPANPAVETRPPEQTAPNEETPGYEPKNS